MRRAGADLLRGAARAAPDRSRAPQIRRRSGDLRIAPLEGIRRQGEYLSPFAVERELSVGVCGGCREIRVAYFVQ